MPQVLLALAWLEDLVAVNDVGEVHIDKGAVVLMVRLVAASCSGGLR